MNDIHVVAYEGNYIHMSINMRQGNDKIFLAKKKTFFL